MKSIQGRDSELKGQIKVNPLHDSDRPLQDAAQRVLNKIDEPLKRRDRRWLALRVGASLLTIIAGMTSIYAAHGIQLSEGGVFAAFSVLPMIAFLSLQTFSDPTESGLAWRKYLVACSGAVLAATSLISTGMITGLGAQPGWLSAAIAAGLVSVAPEWLPPIPGFVRAEIGKEPCLKERMQFDRRLWRFKRTYEISSWLHILATGKDPTDAHHKFMSTPISRA